MSEIKKPAKTAVRKPASTVAKKVTKPSARTESAKRQEAKIQPQVQQQQVQAYAAPAPQKAPVTESIIVQNVLEGPLYISDIGMEFAGMEVRDLTWEDPSIVKRSHDLRRAIASGQLIRITQQQWDDIMYRKAAAARAETQRISQKRTRNVRAGDGRIIEAEVLNLNKADGGRAAQEQVSTAGYANDPMSYASAFAEARAQYQDRGADIDTATFANMVRNIPGIVGRLLNGESLFNDGVISGAEGRGRATVITPGDGYGTGVAHVGMTNYNRDQRLPGIGSYQNQPGYIDPMNPNSMPYHEIPDMVDLDNLDDDDDMDGYAEAIDLAVDDVEAGGIRRL